MFDNFKAYCQELDYLCGTDKWMHKINPFEGVDPYWLALYEDEVYPTYEAQGIDLDAVVQQGLDNPLNYIGLKNMVAQFRIVTLGNPLYGTFLDLLGLKTTNESNREAYYIVKLIEKNQEFFRLAIYECGEWCSGGLGGLP